MELYTRTDIGLVRSSNQDSVDGGFLHDGKVMWAVLCDGMGGANGGSVASSTAVKVARENMSFFDIHASEAQSENFLCEVVAKANSAVYNRQKRDISLHGMGTTKEMVNRGELTPQQARVHPNRNYITRAVGVSPGVRTDYIELPFENNDILIVCSDGLSNYISGESILSYSKLYEGDELTNALVEKAKNHGGADNISVAVLYANNILE